MTANNQDTSAEALLATIELMKDCYFTRRKIDKSGYEVVHNTDPYGPISDETRHIISEWPTFDIAEKQLEILLNSKLVETIKARDAELDKGKQGDVEGWNTDGTPPEWMLGQSRPLVFETRDGEFIELRIGHFNCRTGYFHESGIKKSFRETVTKWFMLPFENTRAGSSTPEGFVKLALDAINAMNGEWAENEHEDADALDRLGTDAMRLLPNYKALIAAKAGT